MAIDMLGQLFMFLFPYVALTSSTPYATKFAALHGEQVPELKDFYGSGESLQQLKLFLEFQEHQAEFMAWRQSKIEEVSSFNDWLLPHHAADRPQGSVPPSATVKKVSLLGMALTRLSYFHQLIGEDPFTLGKSLLQKRMQYHRDNPLELVPGVALSFVEDLFILVVVILIAYFYRYEGFWGVCKIPWKVLESTTLGVAHAVLGDSVIESPFQRGEVPLLTEDDPDCPTLEKDGVARPAQMMYRQKWEDLTEGQKYILSGIDTISPEAWDSIRHECRLAQWNIPSPTKDFNDLTAYERKCLYAIGFTRRSWDLEDPDNLKIEQKMWNDMSHYERQEAQLAGVDVHENGPEEWDLRRADIFRMPFEKIDGKSQVHLRNIGFLRDLWKPAPEPWVPSAKETRVTRRYVRWMQHGFFSFLVILQVIFLCWILYEIGLLSFFWDNFFVYLVMFVILLALAVNMTRYFLVPGAQRHWSVLSANVSVVIAHSKDIWNKVQILITFLSKLYRQQCDKCQAGASKMCKPSAKPPRGVRPRSCREDLTEKFCIGPCAACARNLRLGL